MKKIRHILNATLMDVHVREMGDDEPSRVVEGHAAVFGQRSVNLVPWSNMREVYEIMEPGSITEDLIKRSDVVLTAFHNNEIILGRSTNGDGTLELSIDDKGLAFRCELAKTERAHELLTGIRRGDIKGMSFAYITDEDDSENCVTYERGEQKTKDGKEVWVRHVKQVTGLYDVTIAGHPAYPQTDVARRDVEDALIGHFVTADNAEEFARLRECANRQRRIAYLSKQLDLLEY